MKKFALVLGGGGAKGYAHIGVLKVLEKHGLIPDLIVGTSMGSLVGGMYACGKSIDEMIALAKKFNNIGNFSLYSTLFKESLLNTNKVKNILSKEFGEQTFETAKIPFVAVATEINTGKEFHFKSGPLKQGVMASISIPGVFPRIKVGNNYYCDGGLVNNLAEDVAREMLPDACVISVDVIGKYSKQVEKCKPKTLETILNASTLMTQNVIAKRPQSSDLRIEVCQPHIGQMDFKSDKALASIRHGEMTAKKQISKIIELLNK